MLFQVSTQRSSSHSGRPGFGRRFRLLWWRRYAWLAGLSQPSASVGRDSTRRKINLQISSARNCYGPVRPLPSNETALWESISIVPSHLHDNHYENWKTVWLLKHYLVPNVPCATSYCVLLQVWHISPSVQAALGFNFEVQAANFVTWQHQAAWSHLLEVVWFHFRPFKWRLNLFTASAIQTQVHSMWFVLPFQGCHSECHKPWRKTWSTGPIQGASIFAVRWSDYPMGVARASCWSYVESHCHADRRHGSSKVQNPSRSKTQGHSECVSWTACH